MSFLYRMPRLPLTLVILAILAALVWKTGTGSYFYPTLGIAILILIVFVIAIYRMPRSKKKTAIRDGGPKG